MSRPYFNIDNITYTGATLSLYLTYFKLRTNAISGATFSIDGFSNSLVYTLTNSNSQTADYDTNPATIGEEIPYDLLEKNIATLGTSSTTTYTQPTYTVSYGGTVSSTTSLRVQILGVNVVNLTSVAALGGSTSTQFLATTTFSFTGAAANFTGTISSNSLIFTAPTNTGNRYNGLTAVSIIANAAGSTLATASTGNTFSGGLNNYTLLLNYLPLGPVNVANEVYYWSI
jgi:hypothetical protein